MRFRSLSLLTALGVLAFQGCTPPAAPAAGTPADEATLRGMASKYADAFNKHDPKGVSAMMTVDYEDVDPMGRHTQGRDAAEKQMTTDWASMPAGMTMTTTTTYLKWLSGTSAVVGGTYAVTPAMPPLSGKGAWMVTVVKKDSTWLIASSLAADAPPEMPTMAADKKAPAAAPKKKP